MCSSANKESHSSGAHGSERQHEDPVQKEKLVPKEILLEDAVLNLQTHGGVKLRVQDEILEQSSSATYHRLKSHQSQARKRRYSTRQIQGRERNLTSASTRSKGEQYGGRPNVRTEAEGDNDQGQDEVTGRGRSYDSTPQSCSGQETLRSLQENERRHKGRKKITLSF